MLNKIHEGHLGIVKSKQIARDFVYWLGIGKQVEDKVSQCPVCLQHQNKPHAEPLVNHDVIDRPF